MFKEDPLKLYVPICDVEYRQIDVVDYNKYDIPVPDHFVLHWDQGDTRGIQTFVAYAPKGVRKNPDLQANIIRSLAEKAIKELKNG